MLAVTGNQCQVATSATPTATMHRIARAMSGVETMCETWRSLMTKKLLRQFQRTRMQMEMEYHKRFRFLTEVKKLVPPCYDTWNLATQVTTIEFDHKMHALKWHHPPPSCGAFLRCCALCSFHVLMLFWWLSCFLPIFAT